MGDPGFLRHGWATPEGVRQLIIRQIQNERNWTERGIPSTPGSTNRQIHLKNCPLCRNESLEIHVCALFSDYIFTLRPCENDFVSKSNSSTFKQRQRHFSYGFRKINNIEYSLIHVARILSMNLLIFVPHW